jgi:hypothetical protein
MNLRALAALAVLAASGCAAPKYPILVHPPGEAIFAPPALQRLLVLTDRSGRPVYESRLADGAAIAMHHFARETEWKYVDDLTQADARGADAIVYLSTRSSLPAGGWQNLRFARRLVVFNQHLAQMQTLGFFSHLAAAREILAPPHAEIVFEGQHFAVPARIYTRFEAQPGTRTMGTIQGETSSPFAAIDGNAAFVAAPLSFGSVFIDPYRQGYLLASCEALRVALGAPAVPRVALVRFEDVSVEVPTERMHAIVEYMAQRGIPDGIAVIPSQWVKGQQLRELSSDTDLVDTLRFAQAHGARILLHGFHHSYNSPEDFEFWDAAHGRPLPEDSVAWMSGKIEAGLAIERGLGLEPVMWESPHYAASPLDYGVVAKYFAVSWERRRPVAFLPWPLQQDEYGSALLPENLGYIALPGEDSPVAQAMTLSMQLARARAFTVCADCVPAGFLHPSTVTLADVVDYVNGIQALGYRFVDPLALIAPREKS